MRPNSEAAGKDESRSEFLRLRREMIALERLRRAACWDGDLRLVIKHRIEIIRLSEQMGRLGAYSATPQVG